MSWRDLLQTSLDVVDLPWVGGRSLREGSRSWMIISRVPPEYGWYSWRVDGREARLSARSLEPKTDQLHWRVSGYLVGDRIVPDGARVDPDPKEILKYSEKVFLIDEGLDRFVRISAGRICEDGPLIFIQQEFPLGPEDAVQGAFLDGFPSVAQIKEVSPALDAAFRMAIYQREEAERRRRELERLRQIEEEQRQKEERRERLVQQLGDGAGRREMAKIDFAEAARAALRISGAEYLDHRNAPNAREMIVRYRFRQERLECVCDKETLRIVESGICLRDSYTGEQGDTLFSLESLPVIVAQAMDLGVLHVFRR